MMPAVLKNERQVANSCEMQQSRAVWSKAAFEVSHLFPKVAVPNIYLDPNARAASLREIAR
ncbi:protein of unknown function [Hyphomicrobium sp. 1Nfss2.1]